MSDADLSVNREQLLARVRLSPHWKHALADHLVGDSFQKLRGFLKQKQQDGEVIYPVGSLIFNAFELTALDQVKVVILGQDPYHGPRQANGLAFSVQRSIPIPPSLRTVFHELSTDLGIKPSAHGDLTAWATQGVLLLNSVLTVAAGQPTSHQGQGWEKFTDAVIDVLNEQTEHTVFILWGSYAQKKGQRIDTERHLVLKAAHPYPLAANLGGFFGCRVFSKTNQYLRQHGKAPIQWQLTDS